MSGEVIVVGQEEPEYAGHEPGTPLPTGRALIDATFAAPAGDDLSWMEEKHPDGTYRWCRAKKKGGGNPCRMVTVSGMNRCRMHGGASLRGIAAPRFKTGRYTKHMPRIDRRDYNRERLDENITSLADEIAILRMRVKELLSLRDVGNTAEAWKQARESTKAMLRARKFDNEIEFDKAFDKLCEAVLEDADYNYHKELTFQIEQIRKLVDTEQRRLVSMQQLVSSSEFVTALHAVMVAVKDNVRDREEVKATLTAIQRIVIGPHSGQR